MSNVIVLGGHGRVALLTARRLVANGDTVTAVIRKPEQQDDIRATGAAPLVADIEQLDIAGLRELVQGHDAVIWSAGAGGGSADRTWAVDRDAAIRSMHAALEAGVSRYVMVSWAGSGLRHGVPEHDDFFAYAEAKTVADGVLRDSDLDWTVIAPSTLTDDDAVERFETATEQTTVARDDVAALVVATLHDDAAVRRTYRFNTGATPIADFVRG